MLGLEAGETLTRTNRRVFDQIAHKLFVFPRSREWTTDLHKINYVFWVFVLQITLKFFRYQKCLKSFAGIQTNTKFISSAVPKIIQSMNIQKNTEIFMKSRMMTTTIASLGLQRACIKRWMNRNEWITRFSSSPSLKLLRSKVLDDVTKNKWSELHFRYGVVLLHN